MARDMVRVPKVGSAGDRYRAPSMRLGRSQFNKRHKHVTSFDASYLIPVFCKEVLPGETHTLSMDSLIRVFSPLDAPIFDNIEATIDFFFVPNRIVWDNWEEFLGAHDAAGAQDVDYTVPILSGAATIDQPILASYFGLPIGLQTNVVEVQSLPFRCYRLIYNEWYRDQNLIDSVSCPVDDGPDTNTEVGFNELPLKSAKKPDYFTTALPYLQKGDPVTIPLASSTGPVATDRTSGQTLSILSGSTYFGMDSDAALVDLSATDVGVAGRLYVDLTAATAISINALREAAAIQRLLERDARAGTRYNELIRAHFGTDIGDSRIQRPEYIGGGRGQIQVNPVANTSGTATEDQGQLTGVGAGRLQCRWAQSFVEHGHILGLLRARGELGYHQGLDRMWSRSTKYDFYWPELANLGEQPIYNRELWIANDATDDNVFGYQERWAEYRFSKSLITGKLAPGATGSLDFWHLAEDFGSQPVLNQTFIEDQTPMARVTTVDSEPDFIAYMNFEYRVASPMPVAPVPSLMPARF